MRIFVTVRVLVAGILALTCAAPAALAASTLPAESFTRLLAQIDARRVTAAHLDERTHHVGVTLRGGERFLVTFPAADHRVLVDALLHHGVKPIYVVPRAHTVHHVLRYVIGGVVIFLIALGAAVFLFLRRGPRGALPQSPPAA